MCRLRRVARDGPFGKVDIPFLATRVLILKLRSLESTVVRAVLKILQHLSSSTETCAVVLPLNTRSLDSRKSVCDCSEFNSSLKVRTDLSLFPWQLFDQRVGNSLNRAADVSSTYFKSLIENLRPRIVFL